jgi:hypothetical protein
VFLWGVMETAQMAVDAADQEAERHVCRV